MKYVYEGKPIPLNSDSVIKEIVIDTVEALKRMNYLKGFGATAWGKLYRRDLIEKHPFPDGRLYEDLATLYKIIGDAKIIVLGNKIIYYWIQREGSTMRSQFNNKQLFALEAVQQQIEYMKKTYPEVIQSAKVRYVSKIVELMPLALKSTNSKEAYNILKGRMLYIDNIFKDSQMKLSLEIRMFSMLCGFYPTKFVYALHEKIKTLYF